MFLSIQAMVLDWHWNCPNRSTTIGGIGARCNERFIGGRNGSARHFIKYNPGSLLQILVLTHVLVTMRNKKVTYGFGVLSLRNRLRGSGERKVVEVVYRLVIGVWRVYLVV